MANSLKSHFPALAPILGVSPDALYARQRTFVAAGLVTATPGRGPGSGVRASPETLAEFLVAMLTHATMEENIHLARNLGKARSARGTCPLTGASRFKDALARILTSEELASRIREVVVGGALAQAFIRYDGAELSQGPEKYAADPFKSSVFVGKSTDGPGFRFSASMPGEMLVSLAKEISS